MPGGVGRRPPSVTMLPRARTHGQISAPAEGVWNVDAMDVTPFEISYDVEAVDLPQLYAIDRRHNGQGR